MNHKNKVETIRSSFMRIMNARLRSRYPFKPQRNAISARAFVDFLSRWYPELKL